jgi:hypothetical protein
MGWPTVGPAERQRIAEGEVGDDELPSFFDDDPSLTETSRSGRSMFLPKFEAFVTDGPLESVSTSHTPGLRFPEYQTVHFSPKHHQS